MSQNTRLPPQRRHQLIKEHIATKTQDDIAALCGVERRTIVRDIKAMKQSGEWWDWIEYELHRLHQHGDVSDDVKYREIAKLYGKQFITAKEEHAIEGPLAVTVNIRHLNREDLDADTGDT